MADDDDPSPDLCERFVRRLPVTGASISVFGRSGRQSTICASDATAAQLDELQFDLAEGPHWTVLATGDPVLADDISAGAGDEWPVFADAALSLGVRALFAFPLILGAVAVGAVDLYRITAGALSWADTTRAQSLARAIAAAAASEAVRSAQEDSPAGGGSAAMRREVHQAVGMILVQLDVSATDAFSRLRAYAFASERTVQDVAHDVVGRRIDFGIAPD